MLSTLLAGWARRRQQRSRPRVYGLTIAGTQLATVFSWVLIALIASQMDASGVDVSPLPVLAAAVIVAIFWFWLDASIEKRQRKRDLARAFAEIGKPLRRRREHDGTIVDFDPSYPVVHANGSFVWALDRRRRLMRLIMSNYVNSDYVWPFDVTMLGAELVDAPAKRRLWGLLPASKTAESPALCLAVRIKGRDGVEATHNLAFRHSDRNAAEAWHATILDWIRLDQRDDGAASARSS